jgi:hypothetical protein
MADVCNLPTRPRSDSFFPTESVICGPRADVAKLVDAQDLKS